MAMSPQLVVRIAANIDALQAALAQSKSAISATTTGMERMAASFSGDKIVQQAINMSAAIDKVGGVSKLTAAEMERANRVFEKAAEKMAAIGHDGAPAMQALAESTRKVDDASKGWAATLGGDLKTQLTATIAGFVSAQAIIGAVSSAWRAFTGFISSSVQSFMAAESAQRKLTAALSAAGQATPGTIKQYNDLAATFQRTTVYSDDLINEMQALLTQVGGVMPEQMEGALKAATDLASGLGIDLRQATMLVGKAFEGETGTLKRYGIVIDEAKLKAEGLPAVLEAINSKFGGQAAAEMDTTAGKLQLLANKWDNVKESVGAAIAQDPFVRALLDHMIQGFDESAEAAERQDDAITKAALHTLPYLQTLRDHVDRLRESYREAQEQADALAAAIRAIPAAPGGLVNQTPGPLPIPPGTIQSFIDADKALKEAKQSAEAFTKSVIALRAQLSGSALQGDLRKLEDAWKGLTPQQKTNEDVIKRTVTAYQALREQGANSELLNNLAELHRNLQLLNREFTSMAPNIGKVTLPLAKFRIETSGAVVGGRDLNKTLGVEMDDAMRRAAVASREATERMREFREGTVQTKKEVSQGAIEMANAFDTAAQFVGMFGDEMGVLGQVLSVGVSMLTQYADALVNAKNATDRAAAAQQLATSGFMLFIGFVLQQMAAMEQARAQGLAFAEQLSDLAKELDRQHGSFANAQRAAERYGLALDEVRTKYLSITATGVARAGYRGSDADEVARFSQQVDELGERMKALTAGVEKYGLTWADLPDPKDRLQAATLAAKELAFTFDTLVRAGYEVSAVVRGMSGDINAWLSDVLKAGAQIPEQFRPILESLIRAGELSEENARMLLGLADDGVPSLDAITAAAERYGIALEDLGPKVQQLQINEAAKQLVDDWNVLSKATEDWGVLFESMGPKVQQLVDDAIRYGAELPAAMKPMLQAFIDAGQLVDENGEKLTDLSQLTFAADLSQMFEQLIGKLDELISKITGQAVPALASLGTATGPADAAKGIQAIGDAAGVAADQVKSRFAEGFTEVIGDVDELEFRFRRWSEEELAAIDIIALDHASEVIDDISRKAEAMPKEVRVRVSAEVSAAGYKTIEEMEALAARAGRIWSEMAASGRYSASEVQRAWEAWQTAIRAINPDLDDLGRRAAAAGYQTTESLQAAAAASERLWREMAASGRFSASEVQRAWEKWQEDLGKAGMGGMSRAIQSELDDLKRYVDSELPEFNELGERIFGVEEARAMARIKEIEEEAKRAQGAMEGTANTATATIGKSGETVVLMVEGKSKGAVKTVQQLALEGKSAFRQMETSAEEARRKLREVEGAADDIQTLLNDADLGEPFRNAAQDVEDLIDAINRIPTGPGSTSRSMADYAYRSAINSDTRGPAGALYPRSYALGGAPSGSWDTRTLEELRAIRRELSDHQPDVVVVPLGPGESWESFEDRLSRQMPRRVSNSATLRHAWQRAVNGTM